MQNLKSDETQALLTLMELNGFPVKVEHGLYMIRRDVWDNVLEVVTHEQAHEYWKATSLIERVQDCYEAWVEQGKPKKKDTDA